ncbi:MAG TPA: tRNA pseudouridine(55) synthase TruB [Candidatus Limnocylindria bacterium]|nr:tRNA pseudouridine(55) synthase TruB [Candidatus Limnocylindria bacterium]
MLGVVNLDKPVGPTSHDMVGFIRRLTGTRRIGHAGTLDPLASGVLPILVGAATRFSEELTGGRKRYEAVFRLGQRSATDDAEGPLELVDAPMPSEAAIRDALAAFVGTFEQRPPVFSARKHEGRVAHRAARAGAPIEVPPRTVSVDAIDVLAVERAADRVDVRVDLRCGPGTYVRSIARDLGERLGTGGHLHALRRTEASGLAVADAVTPDQLSALAADGRLSDAILPVGSLLPLPRVVLDADAAWRFVHGSAQPHDGPDARVAAFAADGSLIGVGRIEAETLRPEKVVPQETSP